MASVSPCAVVTPANDESCPKFIVTEDFALLLPFTPTSDIMTSLRLNALAIPPVPLSALVGFTFDEPVSLDAKSLHVISEPVLSVPALKPI